MRWRAALMLLVLAVGIWIAVGPAFEGTSAARSWPRRWGWAP